MCGIVAVASLDGRPVDLGLVRRMTESRAHRRPDGSGVLGLHPQDTAMGGNGPSIGFGNRRLAILDLSDRAAQPMALDGVTVTYNGEIYNFIELRAELEALGHAFATTSDTEVLLHAYQQWGTACVERFNGIFAFVIWDEDRGRLVAARDRMGVKPLYWVATGGRLCLASEIRALRICERHSNIDEGLLYDFLVAGRMEHSDATFFQGVRRLPAGCLLELCKGDISTRPYWKPAATDERYGRSLNENAEEFADLFRDAIRIQMRADVPVACCLSGGLDSTAVAAVASDLTTVPLTLFTARYRYRKIDEWRYAQALHRDRRVIPVQVFVEPKEYWVHLDEVLKAQEEPFANPSVFAQWRLMKEINANGIKVVLDGQGGDELLCGYAKYYYFNLADLLRSQRWLSATVAVMSAFSAGGPQLFNLAGARRYIPGGWFLRRLRSSVLQSDFLARLKDRPIEHPRGSVIDQQILDLTRFGLPTLLRYEDKNSMAHSVESRVPFLDHRLVEFALSVPVEHKIRGARSKVLLRTGLRGTIPEMVRRRRSKLGFGGHWNLWVSELKAEIEEWLASPRLHLDPYVRRAALRELATRCDPDIFRFLVLDRWLHLVQDGVL